MADQLISIPVDPQAAAAYERATPEEKRKLHSFFSRWIREFTNPDRPTLAQVLDEAGRKAHERGLTPEILESILKDTSEE